jgi:FdhE protein
MQRILDPAQIEAFAQRSIPRIRLADPVDLFSRRAERLRKLSENHALGDYLRLMAAVSDAQQGALAALTALPPSAEPAALSFDRRVTQAQGHGMPLLQADGWPRDSRWLAVLTEICSVVAALPDMRDSARVACDRVRNQQTAQLEEQADLLLGARTDGVNGEAAPFVMSALQVCWVHMVTSLSLDRVRELGAAHDEAARADVPGVCPMCGTLPVASIVRADKQYQGYRYLHCALCATEWHLVRIKCSHCLATEHINYHYVEGGSAAVRAESCGKCKTYRKILYQEKDTAVEPVADDLGSLALDLLMTEEGCRRASGNPLLWQPMEA